MTKKQKKLRGAELTDTPSQRLKPGALDEYYLEAALEYPGKSQKDLLQIAMDRAGHNGKATKQHAYKIADRMRDRIIVEAEKLATDIKYLGVSRLKEMLTDETVTGSTLLGAITLSTKDIFPNVSIKKEQTIDELDKEIDRLQQEINQVEGKGLH